MRIIEYLKENLNKLIHVHKWVEERTFKGNDYKHTVYKCQCGCRKHVKCKKNITLTKIIK